MSSLDTFFVTKIYRAELDDPRHTALNARTRGRQPVDRGG